MRTLAAPSTPLPMSPDERAFFQTVGGRIAQARKDADLTQVQLAEALGIPQPQLASYEVGRRRVPVSMLPRLARVLDVPIEELISEEGAGPPPPPPRSCAARTGRRPPRPGAGRPRGCSSSSNASSACRAPSSGSSPRCWTPCWPSRAPERPA